MIRVTVPSGRFTMASYWTEAEDRTMQQLEAIKDAARKAARASLNGDAATAKFQHQWAQRAIMLENDPTAARQAYRKAYRETAEPIIEGRARLHRWET